MAEKILIFALNFVSIFNSAHKMLFEFHCGGVFFMFNLF